MNPYEAPGENSIGLFEEGGPTEDRMRRFVGGYFRILGWIGVATTVISIATVYWTDYLHIDLAFLIWFWLGTCLKRGSSTARKWAIAIFLLVTLFSVISLFLPNVNASFGDMRFDRSHPAFYGIIGLIWLIFAVPGLVLMSRRGRAAFTNQKQGEQGVGGQPATTPRVGD